MIKRVLFIAFIQFIALNVLNAQSSDELLSGEKSSFQISSNSVNLNALDQILILKNTKATKRKNGRGKYRFSYQSTHLEFSVNDRIANIYSANSSDRNKYNLSFFDGNDNLIISILIPDYYVKRHHNPSSTPKLYFYSIDLLDIPRIILDKASKIDIIKLGPTK